MNGLLLLPAWRTGSVAGEVEDCVLHWDFGAFSFRFGVGAVSPAGSGVQLLRPPVGPSPCSHKVFPFPAYFHARWEDGELQLRIWKGGDVSRGSLLGFSQTVEAKREFSSRSCRFSEALGKSCLPPRDGGLAGGNRLFRLE